MMYNNQFILAIKDAKGKILREFNKDTVYLPFGTEYSILVKNLNSERAIFHLEIDGKSIQDDDSGFVINGNDEMTIERFVDDNSKGNRFKFIERTEKIENHRGIKADDGLVRLTWQYEDRPVEVPRIVHRNHYIDHYHHSWNGLYWNDCHGYSGILRGRGMSADASAPLLSGTSTQLASNSVALNNVTPTAFVNETGITAKGSVSDQAFKTVSGFPLQKTKHVMVMRLLGQSGNTPVVHSITTDHKLHCENCGTANKPNAKFCAECGTVLEPVKAAA